ncbi:lipopolysaccharide-induced tumor necrosis factor-alpha factor homolog [Cynoglossus semilaevis]|uniref:lipopolysaccharide-induced tumor necrosis factor-alpha factor homolog n=1 Tax=Cynoglossus semilaevis TaxID=244447 RepID=UPI0004979965|nr:lipopolysaccharide-induced tumor necrosis factor-alpha factor homolog [Cynoglossus semilaevis]
MEPPSYEEASLHPPVLTAEGFNSPPPPSYYATISSPSTPPPTYGEAVTAQTDPFPVLSRPSARNNEDIIHSHTQVGTSSARGSRPAVIVTQPVPVPIMLSYLTDQPGLVRCQYCHKVVTTQVTYLPGKGAWCMCAILSLMGLICGFCLIPLMIRGLQDAYHACPECGNNLHVFKR